MNENPLFEQMGGTYTEINGILYSNLVIVNTNYEIRFWRHRYKEYLKQNHRVIYYNLLTQGKLNSYLHNIDIKAKYNIIYLLNNLLKAKEYRTTQSRKSNVMSTDDE